MSAKEPLDPGNGRQWAEQARETIHHLEENAPPRYNGQRIAPYSVHDPNPRAYDASRLDVVRCVFRFNGPRFVTARLQRVAMVALLRAMREEPSIEIGFGSAFYATYRTHEMQADLYEAYLHGGPLAAPPGPFGSFHQGGISLDLGNAGPAGSPVRDAMEAHGFRGLLPQDPPHHTYGQRG